MKINMPHSGEVLLVDDDPDLLKLISLRLSSAGYRVRTADSGETALAALASHAPGGRDHRSQACRASTGSQLFDAIHRQHPALPGDHPDCARHDSRGRVSRRSEACSVF